MAGRRGRCTVGRRGKGGRGEGGRRRDDEASATPSQPPDTTVPAWRSRLASLRLLAPFRSRSLSTSQWHAGATRRTHRERREDSTSREGHERPPHPGGPAHGPHECARSRCTVGGNDKVEEASTVEEKRQRQLKHSACNAYMLKCEFARYFMKCMDAHGEVREKADWKKYEWISRDNG